MSSTLTLAPPSPEVDPCALDQQAVDVIFEQIVGPENINDGGVFLPESVVQVEPVSETEAYAASMETMRRWGAQIVRGEVAVGSIEQSPAGFESLEDFITALQENLATDQDYGEQLFFDRERIMRIVGGRVVTEEGEPLADVITRGRQYSEREAAHNPVMGVQAERDRTDEYIVKLNDSLPVGAMHAALLRDPYEAMQQNSQFFEALGQVGYREGMSVLQMYFKPSENEMVAWAVAIKRSGDGALREFANQAGMNIAEGTHSSQWARNGLVKETTLEEARAFGSSFRDSYAMSVGDLKMKSTTEFIEANRPMITEYFKQYGGALAEAAHTKKNNPILQDLAQKIAATNIASMTEKEREHLTAVSNGENFDGEMGSFMESQIRYALLEQLRTLIPAFLNEQQPAAYTGQSVRGNRPIAESTYSGAYVMTQMVTPAMMAGLIGGGRDSGRSYGGCSAVGAPGSGPDNNQAQQSIPDVMDVFGRAGADSGEASMAEEGEKEMTCPFCEEKTVGDPCGDKIVCTECCADSSLDETENQRRAASYHAAKDNPSNEVRSHEQNVIDAVFSFVVESVDELQPA